MDSTYSIRKNDGPIVASAIHNGHQVRKELQDYLNLDEAQRLMEEDPFTAGWTDIVPTNIVVGHSRFELDVNRPRNEAIYLKPEDAWGLEVWKKELPPETVEESLRSYDQFYSDVKGLFDEKIAKYDYFILYDLHSYNHRRKGPDEEKADPQANPEVNLGTRHMDREKWAPVVEAFMNSLSTYDYSGRTLDVRENIKFKGGYFVKWAYETYQDKCCAMAIEFKKFFMDEWTGKLDEGQHKMIKEALRATLPDVLEAVNSIKR